MNSEWWAVYSLLILSLGINYWLIHKLNQSSRLISALQSIIKGINANRKGQTFRPINSGESAGPLPGGNESQNGGNYRNNH